MHRMHSCTSVEHQLVRAFALRVRVLGALDDSCQRVHDSPNFVCFSIQHQFRELFIVCV